MQGKTMLHAIRSNYLPNKVMLWRSSNDADALARLAPYTKGQKSIAGKATAYVCKNFQCNQPTTDPGQALLLLRE